MTLPLRGIDFAAVEAVVASGVGLTIPAGPELRRYSATEPLAGKRWAYTLPDQSVVNVVSFFVKDHCQWCRRTVKMTASVPIPLTLSNNGGHLLVTGRGTFCSFECAAGLLNREMGWPTPMRDVNHTHSWQLLHLLFARMHPGKRLIPAPDHVVVSENSSAAVTAAGSGFRPLPHLTVMLMPHSYAITS